MKASTRPWNGAGKSSTCTVRPTCSNRTIRKVDAKGQAYPCLYIRKEKLGTDWLKEQQTLLDSINPGCRQCSVYDMCGGAYIVSQEHAQECRFYKALYTWFQKEVNRP